MARENSFQQGSHICGLILPLYAVVSLICAKVAVADSAFVLEPGNPPQVVMPVATDETTTFAAEELSHYLGKILGDPPKIVAEDSADPRRGQIHLGPTTVCKRHAADVARLAEDGFVLLAVPETQSDAGYRFCINGSNPRGTLYGVYALLEDHLDCRWPEPGVNAEVIPKRRQIDLSGINRRDAPSLPHRCLRIRHLYEGSSLKDYIDWQAKQRMNYLYWHGCYHEYADRRKTTEPFHENGGALLNFIRKRGFVIDNSSHCFKRFFAVRPVDMSSKDAEDQIVAELLEHLERSPFLDLIGLWPGDGWGGSTRVTAESCPLDFPDTRLITQDLDWRATTPKIAVTNTYVDFVNRVQERIRQRWPKVSLTLIAYNRTLLPPDKVRCAPGQQVHVGFRRSYSYGFGDPKSVWNSRQRVEMNKWITGRQGRQPNTSYRSVDDGPLPLVAGFVKELTIPDVSSTGCDHVVLFEYYQTGNLGSIGRPFPHTIAADLKYLKQVGAAGTASQSRSDLFRSLGPNYYTYAKFSWNVDADVESVLDDYFQSVYGPAAPAAKQLFDLWEATYNQGGDYFRYDWNVIVPLFTPDVRRQMLDLATTAKRQAETGTPANRRHARELALVIDGFDAFMRFAQTGDRAAKKKAEQLNRSHPFVRVSVKSLSNAERLHKAGF